MLRMSRSIIGIKRQLFKTGILFLSIFILSLFTSSSVFIQNAITNTDMALRGRLPGIVTLRQDAFSQIDAETTEYNPLDLMLHGALIRDIGSFPQINLFDYTIWGYNFYSSELLRVFESLPFFEEINIYDMLSLRTRGYEYESFRLKGIHNHYIADVVGGLLNIVRGRTFTPEEVLNGERVVFISEAFRQKNNLSVGDQITLEYRVYNESNLPIAIELFEMEIVGTFSHEIYDEMTENFNAILQHIEIINRFYVPNKFIENTIYIYKTHLMTLYPDLFNHINDAEIIEDVIQYDNIIFLLHDPMDILSFKEQVQPLLPSFWVLSDLSDTYRHFFTAMNNLTSLTNHVFIGASFATVVLLSLLLMIFNSDRKGEIGIYLILGEKKLKIFMQLLSEVVILSLIAITFSLLLGNFLSESISAEFLRTHLINESNNHVHRGVEQNTPEALGFRFEMTNDEMLDMFSIDFDLPQMLLFIGFKLSVIIISSSIILTFFINTKVINLVLKGNIG